MTSAACPASPECPNLQQRIVKVSCAAQEFMTPEFKKQWFRKKAHELPAGAELVSCVPLDLVLKMFGISHIDFLSLDVEVMLGNHCVTIVGLSQKWAPTPSTSMLSLHRCCIPSRCPARISDRDEGRDVFQLWLVLLFK